MQVVTGMTVTLAAGVEAVVTKEPIGETDGATEGATEGDTGGTTGETPEGDELEELDTGGTTGETPEGEEPEELEVTTGGTAGAVLVAVAATAGTVVLEWRPGQLVTVGAQEMMVISSVL